MASLHDRLKAETAVLHAAVEREIGLLDPDLDHAGYLDILSRLHAFHAALEPEISAALGESDPVPGWRRLDDLRADLDAHGQGIDGPRGEAPTLSGPADAIGALYVVEGSRLGGRAIARHLESTLGLDRNGGMRYFGGSCTGARWAAFRQRLAAHESEADRVIAAAIATFVAFRRTVCLGALEPSA